MSAFAALWHLDGAPASTASVRAMLEAMPGGSGYTIWNNGPVALGQATGPGGPQTPAGAHEHGLAIAGAYRLDNHAELERELGGCAADGPDPSDAELILRAYRRWDASAPERLLGDFAFVLWDESRRRMLCVRDQMGIAPFYYHLRGGATLACATEARALLAVPGITPRLDEAGVAAYLAPVLNDGSVTLVRDVHRLEAGAILEVGPQGAHVHRYWRPNPHAALRLSSDREYAEALRETLTAAVRCRLPARQSEGTAVSGGLDSSSVGVLIREARARARPTPAVSVLFDDGDERSSIQAVIALGGFDWRPVSWSGAFLPDPAADIGFFTSHTVVNRDAFAEAARSGVSVLFGGGGGDEALPWGLLATAPASFAMRAGRWGTAARLLGRAAVRRLRVPRPDGPGASEPLDLLSPALGRRLDAVSRASEQLERGRGASPRAQHARLLEVKGAIGMREAEAALAARHGIELRSPFWDRRVVELCLAMPLALKEARDPPRYVLRRAMGSLLPAAVLSAEKWSAWPIYVEAARRIHREEPEPPGADGPLSELTHQVRVRDSWTAVGHPNPPPHCVSDVLVMASLQRQIESHGLH